MKILILATAAMLGLAGAQPASAADVEMPTKAPTMAPAPTFSWSGVYVGGNFGGGWGHTDYDSYLSSGALDFTGSYDSSGIFGGGQIGINFMVTPEVLFGFEADGDWSDISGNSPGCTATGCSTGHTTINDFGSARFRAGYAWNNLLLYGTGGWAWSESGTDRTIKCVGATCAAGGSGIVSPLVGMVASSSGTQSGWAAGAGVEWGFLPHWSLRLQYLHLEFDNIGRDFAYPGFPTAFRHTEANTGLDTVSIGVNYLFNWAPPGAYR